MSFSSDYRLGHDELCPVRRESAVDGRELVPEDRARDGRDRRPGFEAHRGGSACAVIHEVRVSICDYVEIGCDQSVGGVAHWATARQEVSRAIPEHVAGAREHAGRFLVS